MTWMIELDNENNAMLDAERLINAVATVLRRHEVEPETGVSIVITTNEEVQALNLEYRGVDAPTDILSFPADPLPPELGEPPYLGDLIVAYPYAQAQAEREKHPLNDSLALLVVHGTLHLLGYDHDTPENRAVMWAEQATILTELGIDTAIVPALEGEPDAPHD